MGSGMSATAFRAWSVPEPKLAPAERLAWALDLARKHFGEALPPVLYVHPLTVAETPAPEGVALVARAEVGRFGYWVPTDRVEARKGKRAE
jgi:hypothetical protein